ncbi:hypothetical protein K040078D81_44260 [Blautia hominis]|uniref:HTH cro/C1-type domain-containing protein n=1 Tax=Blautia hominis TaxID=2025493 RepID=A0ABQ0BFR9_9FIRM
MNYSEINYLEIGKRIRYARKSQNKTQEWLAEQVDVGTTHISHIETGNTKLSLKTLILIANALNVSSNELLCDNLVNSQDVYNVKINKILEECDNNEKKIINEILNFVLILLRKYNIT